MDPLTLVKDTPFSHYTASATKLTGGLVNYVWRLVSEQGETIIVKYAGSTLSAHPEVKFSTERMDFEARALALFNELDPELLEKCPLLKDVHELGKHFRPTEGVCVPKLLYYDPDVPFMILEDIGNIKDYESWCKTTPPEAMAADDVFVCGLVGEWVARLHGFGREHLDALKPTFTNTPARNIVGGVFESVSAKFLKHTDFEDKQEVAACIDAFYQGQADKPAKPSDHDRTLLFGDLWSGSVLFNESTRAVNLLDFEFADIGKVHGDIGHFVAHILPLYFVSNKDYDPNTDPCPPNVREFLLAYKRTLLAEYPDVYRAVIEDAVQKSASLFAIELTGEVLSGKWCRCGKESTEKHAPLKCKCGDTLLRFTRPYIKGSTETIFNLLK